MVPQGRADTGYPQQDHPCRAVDARRVIPAARKAVRRALSTIMPEYLIQLICAVPLAALLWLAATGPALAWGAGHIDQTRAVFERLPRAIRSSFSRATVEQAVQSDSEYPDSPDPFDANRIGADAVARLAAHGIKTREGL